MSGDGCEPTDADIIASFQIILIAMLSVAVFLASLGYYADISDSHSYLPVPINDTAR